MIHLFKRVRETFRDISNIKTIIEYQLSTLYTKGQHRIYITYTFLECIFKSYREIDL